MSYVFGAMITISFIYAVFSGNIDQMSTGIPEAAGSAIELLISVSGMLIMWSGFMRIAKDCGLIEKLSRLFAPLLSRLYPDVAVDSDAFRYISMNISANLLGLGKRVSLHLHEHQCESAGAGQCRYTARDQGDGGAEKA